MMKQRLIAVALRLQSVLKDTRGQDLIEYALMAGFVAVSASALLPNIAPSLSSIFSRVGSVVALVAG